MMKVNQRSHRLEDDVGLYSGARLALFLGMASNLIAMVACWCLYFFPVVIALSTVIGALGAFMGYAIRKREPPPEIKLMATIAMISGGMAILNALLLGGVLLFFAAMALLDKIL